MSRFSTQPRLTDRADRTYLIEIIDGANRPRRGFCRPSVCLVAAPGSRTVMSRTKSGASAFRSHGGSMTAAMQDTAALPDMKVSVRQVFGIDSDMEVPAYSKADEHVPDIDADYRFDRPTTMAILAGFAKNRRVMVTGYHGTGKSTHIEQVAARLNWPCVRVNLDSHISRIDLVGKDSIVIRDGKQVTEFRDGILPWALQHNIALVFDE